MRALAIAGLMMASTLSAEPFSYQGELQLNGVPVDDMVDFDFSLWDADIGGNQVGVNDLHFDVMAINGRFAVEIDVGDGVFDGTPLWLEVSVRNPAGAGAYDLLAPRQPLTPSPYALFALSGNPGPQGPEGPEGPQGPAGDSHWELIASTTYYLGPVGIGTDTVSPETALQITAGVDNFGVLVDSSGVAGSSIGLHAGPVGFSSLAKNAFFDGAWQRFDEAHGAYLQEVTPTGAITFHTTPADTNPIAWNQVLHLNPEGNLGMGTTTVSTETRLHVSAGGDNFGVLVDSLGAVGSSIGLHAGPSGFSGMAKNAFFLAGWNRFLDDQGAFLQQVFPSGEVEMLTTPAGMGPIVWNTAMRYAPDGRVGSPSLSATSRFNISDIPGDYTNTLNVLSNASNAFAINALATGSGSVALRARAQTNATVAGLFIGDVGIIGNLRATTLSLDSGTTTIEANELNVLDGGLTAPVYFHTAIERPDTFTTYQIIPGNSRDIEITRVSCTAQFADTGIAPTTISVGDGTDLIDCVIPVSGNFCSTGGSFTLSAAENLTFSSGAVIGDPGQINCTVEGEIGID